MTLKRVFPLIIFLIVLSVMGVVFIQMSWIKNAIVVKREQYQKDVDNAGRQVRDVIIGRFIEKARRAGRILLSPEDIQFFLDREFTIQAFSEEEVRQVIDQRLRANKIRQPFEFSVTNIFRYPVLTSDHFQATDMPRAVHIRLTGDNAYAEETLHILIQEPKDYIIRSMGWMIVASIIFTSIIISAFVISLRTLLNQKKVSEIKNDFINNMTHELKTPLATISLAVDALTNEKVISRPDQVRYYSDMIKQENRRMNQQVETILQSARLERQEMKLNKQRLDAHEVIRTVANNTSLLVQQKNGELTLKLNASRHLVDADEVHFSNIIFNLLDNAIKYSKEAPRIEITTQNSSSRLLIKVKDNGIGISKDTLAHVFEKFYRAHTGNLHDVKGFGLGLSYVKAVAEAHEGGVRAESVPGKGSTFTIVMPVATGPAPTPPEEE